MTLKSSQTPESHEINLSFSRYPLWTWEDSWSCGFFATFLVFRSSSRIWRPKTLYLVWAQLYFPTVISGADDICIQIIIKTWKDFWVLVLCWLFPQVTYFRSTPQVLQLWNIIIKTFWQIPEIYSERQDIMSFCGH